MPLWDVSFFSGCLYNFLFITGFRQFDGDMWFSLFLLPEFIDLLESVAFSFHQFWKVFNHYFLKHIFYPPTPIWVSNYLYVRLFDSISNSIDVLIFSPILFSLWASFCISFIVLCSNSLVISSAVSNRLLITSNVLFF